VDIAAVVLDALRLILDDPSMERLPGDARLVEDLGLDSASRAEFIAIVEDRGVTVDPDRFASARAVDDLVAAIRARF